MRYRLRLWNFSQYNTTAWEEEMNREAAAGWNFRSLSLAPPNMICYERADPGVRKQYTVTVYKSPESGLEYEKDIDEYIDFYRQAGWRLSYHSGNSFIFEADAERKTAPAYGNLQERVSLERQTIQPWRIAVTALWIAYVCWDFAHAWAFASLADAIFSAFFAVFVLNFAAEGILEILYGKGKGGVSLLKWLDFFESRAISLLSALVFGASAVFTAISAIGGNYTEIYLDGDSFACATMVLGICSIPLFLAGEYIILIRKCTFIGTILYIPAMIGAIFNVYYGLNYLGI